MLDIYSISDPEARPEYPEESNYVGALTLEQYKILKCVFEGCKLHGIQFGFFKDTRLYSPQVKIMLECCKNCYQNENELSPLIETTYGLLFEVLESLIESNYGLMAFCD